MNRKLTAVILAALGCFSLNATELFVDCNSTNDAQDGTKQAPFKTIDQAIKKSVGGDIITVAQGTYREKIFYFKRKSDKKTVIRAAAGARPIISGFRQLTRWTKGADGLYRTTVNYKPHNLLINGVYQQLARLPESGWLRMNYTGDRQFTAKTQEVLPAGVTCYTWFASINVFGDQTLAKTVKPGTYQMTPRTKGCKTTKNGDRFFFLNHPSIIRKSGQWCWTTKDKKTYEIVIKLDTPPEKSLIEVGGSLDYPIYIRYSSNIELDGFDVTGGAGGIWCFVNEGITLKNMAIYWCNGGLFIRGNKNVLVDKCRVTCTLGGLTTVGNDNLTIRNCDIGYNYEDGLRITWKSNKVLVENNRVHHHMWWGHPDNFQLYRDVNDVLVKDCIFYASGQGQMTEQVTNVRHENCIFVGSDAYMVIWTPSCHNFSMKNSTYLMGGYASLLMTGKNITVDSCVYDTISFRNGRVREDMNYKARNNHFIISDNWHMFCDNKWHWNRESFIKSSGDVNSTEQRKPVPGMPAAYATIDASRIDECTNETFATRNTAKKFKLGDTVEICADGVPRTVTKITKDSITVTPPRKYAPAHAYPIFNWGGQKLGKWSSNGITNKNAGATTDLSYITIDKLASEIPIPQNVQDFIKEFDRLIPPYCY